MKVTEDVDKIMTEVAVSKVTNVELSGADDGKVDEMKVTGVEEIVDPQVMNITVNEEKCCEVTQVDILEGTEVEEKVTEEIQVTGLEKKKIAMVKEEKVAVWKDDISYLDEEKMDTVSVATCLVDGVMSLVTMKTKKVQLERDLEGNGGVDVDIDDEVEILYDSSKDGEKSVDIGDASAVVGDASAVVGDASGVVGDASGVVDDVSAVVGDASSDVVDAGGSEDMLLQLAQDYPGISVTLKKF